MATAGGLGQNDRVSRARLALASLPALIAGCLGFGGPLVSDGETTSTSATGTESGAETETETETETGETSPCGPLTAKVTHVIDGDTIEIETGQRVRYILVDTTEVTNSECWSTEGTAFNSTMTLGKTVSLEYDQECTDVFGRLLAYVSVDGVEVNRALLENGHACLLYIPPNGNDKVAEYQTLETAAREQGLAMWGACDPVPCD